MANTNAMKILTFNQLQIRLLSLLFFLFASATFGYRYFIELPKLEKSMSMLQQRELNTLSFSIANMQAGLARANFDYAAWTATYRFMRTRNENYLTENFVDNTFTGLEIDGVFYIDEHLQPVFIKGLHHKTLSSVEFSFYDFSANPDNINMLPIAITGLGAPKKSGFIATQHGPAMFNVTQIRDSYMKGEHRGFLIMIKLLQRPFSKKLSRYTLTDISYRPLAKTPNIDNLPVWDSEPNIIQLSPFTDIVINDINGRPITVLRMKHNISATPTLIDEQSLVFILLLSLFVYFVYRLVASTIIDPVKRLAVAIKSRNIVEGFKPLNENYKVTELSTVSKNMNKLMLTIQEQNKILEEQVTTDQLTQIMNRRGLLREIDRHNDLCHRDSIGFVVVMADIDYFKNYNDALGHVEGDMALAKVADILNRQCQRVNDVCARYGGEEFTMIFSQMTTENLAFKLDAIVQSLKNNGLVHPRSTVATHVSVSMGATIIKPSDSENGNLLTEDILKAADSAMYEAKHAGRNGFVIQHFSDDLNEG